MAEQPPKKQPVFLRSTMNSRQYLSALEWLEETQNFNNAQLLNYQFQQLRPLLTHACQNIPHYRQAFLNAGLTPETVTPENWHLIPILQRDTLQRGLLHTQNVPSAHGRLIKKQSSGSTGQPVTVFKTEFSQHFHDLLTIRDCRWHGWNLTAKLASIRHFPDAEFPAGGIMLANWGPPLDMLFTTGPSVLLSIRASIDTQLQWLARHQPNYLHTYPSNLVALIEESQRAGLKFPDLMEVRVTSETVPADLATMCKKEWGVPLTASYSSEELGYMAIQCPGYDHYHVQAENVLVEILDDDWTPCQPGEIGRVVVTSLLNYATPLIRYAIQDYAEAGDRCPCGRGLPVIRRIVGRQRNIMVLPTGEKRWPVVSSARYREIAPVKQYQFVQHSPEQIEMRLVVERELREEELRELRELIKKSFGYPFQLQFTMMESLPRGVNGKYEEFISMVRH